MPPAKRVKNSPTDQSLTRSPPTPTAPHDTIDSDKENQDTDKGIIIEGDNSVHTPRKASREAASSLDKASRNSNSPEQYVNNDLLKQTENSSPSLHYGKGAGSYNALKSFNGHVYSGMAVGGSHVWNYDPGIWKETKEEPDLWKIDFETTKRRAKNAPKGSGAPVGTKYHWLIVAHQYVTKTDANTYTTHLKGSKYKLAHSSVSTSAASLTSPKLALSTSWSIPTVKAQRDRELDLLEDAKRRVRGLPPVLASERVKGDGGQREKGQMRLDEVFGRSAGASTLVSGGGGGGEEENGGRAEVDRRKRKR